jgi:BirA family biotin operon repressor/biotin-[acetyl-CoA-carboxylase] ligase
VTSRGAGGPGGGTPEALGHPRVHLRLTDSTNARARALAAAGAPHGTVVTAREQSAGRGRQGRTWSAAAGKALLCSVILRSPPRLLPLAVGVAVAETCEAHGRAARLKWPNDVLLDGRKVAGILVEGRPQQGWAVAGIGLNVAQQPEDFSPELREAAGSLGLAGDDLEPLLGRLLERLAVWCTRSDAEVVAAFGQRDVLQGAPVRWSGGSGTGAGVDGAGRLLVDTGRELVSLDAGEVHLGSAGRGRGLV